MKGGVYCSCIDTYEDAIHPPITTNHMDTSEANSGGKSAGEFAVAKDFVI